jgi:hypothetical protein
MIRAVVFGIGSVLEINSMRAIGEWAHALLKMTFKDPALFTVWTADRLHILDDLGFEADTIAFKKTQERRAVDTQKTHHKAHNCIRAIGERGNSLLKMTFKALRNVSLWPWPIGRIVAEALVLLHIDHGHTT